MVKILLLLRSSQHPLPRVRDNASSADPPECVGFCQVLSGKQLVVGGPAARKESFRAMITSNPPPRLGFLLRLLLGMEGSVQTVIACGFTMSCQLTQGPIDLLGWTGRPAP